MIFFLVHNLFATQHSVFLQSSEAVWRDISGPFIKPKRIVSRKAHLWDVKDTPFHLATIFTYNGKCFYLIWLKESKLHLTHCKLFLNFTIHLIFPSLKAQTAFYILTNFQIYFQYISIVILLAQASMSVAHMALALTNNCKTWFYVRVGSFESNLSVYEMSHFHHVHSWCREDGSRSHHRKLKGPWKHIKSQRITHMRLSLLCDTLFFCYNWWQRQSQTHSVSSGTSCHSLIPGVCNLGFCTINVT